MKIRNFVTGVALLMSAAAFTPATAEAPKNDPDFMQEEGMILYRQGNWEQAVEIWKKKAAAGDGNAAYQLGVVHTDGQVMQPDYAAAVEFLIIGAEAGDKRAQFDLGSFYDGGLGTRRNIDEAFRWYKAAAEQRLDVAMFNVAMMYYDGAGTDRDLVQSYRWMYLAHAAGVRDLGDVSLERISSELSKDDLKKAIKLARETFK